VEKEQPPVKEDEVFYIKPIKLFKNKLNHASSYFLPLQQLGLSQVTLLKCLWSKMVSVSGSGHSTDTLYSFATYSQMIIKFLFMLKEKQVSLTQVRSYSLLHSPWFQTAFQQTVTWEWTSSL